MTGVCTIGLDVGGTKIAGGVVGPGGEILLKQIIPTQPQRGGEAVLADTVRLTQALLAEAGQLGLEIGGIGLGVAELVGPQGRITSSHTIAWEHVPVQATLAQLAPTVIESDVRAAALAEATFGAGRGYELAIYVTVGTGISSCLIQAGQPYAGARGNALVLANSPLTTHCTECGAVLEPILENLATGPALVSRYQAELEEWGLTSALPYKQVKQAEDVLEAATAGDKVAINVIKMAGEALGVSLGWLVNVLDPEIIIIGGGLGLAGGLYWQSLVSSTRAHIWATASRETPITPAALGPDAGLIGAAATVRRSYEG